MYLKSIEIQGFKSFANKIRLDFHNGFTAIVGPNGSGKSNIADAVRWVLGEQRAKQLRGGSMQDVIFAGTELRKPLSCASVAITFDNSDHRLSIDYEEVTVARRLYRSGESEYLLNNVQVRLRDVQELFYDTGIGKEGYSIIGQGQIDRILSDKPEDRRELFDEAAGIVKFKRRKETSLRKLESEQANLVRVSDILSELEKQVGPLEQQAQKAQSYLKAREELKRLDVNLFLAENRQTSQRLEELSGDLSLAQGELEQIRQQAESARLTYDQIQAELAELETTIEKSRDDIARTNAVRNQLETQIQVGEESIRSMKASAEHFRSREESVREQIAQREREQRDLAGGKAGVDDVIAMLEKFRAEAQAELEEVQEKEQLLRDTLEEKRAGLMQVLNQRGTIKARLASVTERRGQYESQRADLEGRLEQSALDEEEHDRELERLTQSFEEAGAEVSRLNERQREVEGKIEEQKRKLTLSDERLRAAETEYHQEQSRLDALVNLTERYEGFGGSIRRVMAEKDREPGLIGVVADLIKTQPRYETAIETALGGSIQNIVTDNEATAKRMIELLKREKAGRATFLPLTAVRSTQPFNMTGALKERGVIGLADTLVRTAPEHRDAARSLLGRTLVVDDYDHAVEISRRYQQRIRIVTLSGELFQPGGSVSGGAFRNPSNLLGRRREIAELQRRTEELRGAVQEARSAITQAKEDRNRFRAELEAVRTSLQAQLMEQNSIRISIEAEEARRAELLQGHDVLMEENASAQESGEALRQEEESIREELEQSLESERRANEEIEEMSSSAASLRGSEDEKSAALRKWDIEIQKNRQKQEYEAQELSRLESERSRLQKELEEILSGIRESDASILSRRDAIDSIRETIESSRKEQEAQRRLLEESQARRSLLTQRQQDLVRERDRLSGEQNRLDREAVRLENLRSRAEESIESQINHLWDEYEITPSEAAALRDETLTDVPRMKSRAEELNRQIKGLGNVNVGAIQEYQEVKERYTFLKGQHDDLVAAAQSLQKIIEDLDVQMRRRFRTQFEQIQKEFDRVFRQLFGGGTGRLELMEGEDILVAGVRVIAQPPGKKLQNMMQMSGGEKALTAIALLFAIQNLKPSPFCLLDEIEAALDESNVARFADYLRRLSEQTQFIVITHRRGTMDRADRLYGITMQEKGVSTLVSVSLITEDDLVS